MIFELVSSSEVDLTISLRYCCNLICLVMVLYRTSSMKAIITLTMHLKRYKILIIKSQNLGCLPACYIFSWKRITFLIEELALKVCHMKSDVKSKFLK